MVVNCGMLTMMKTFLGLLVLAVLAQGQEVADSFTAYIAITNPSSQAITLQKPTTSNRVIRPQAAWIHSTVATTVTLELRGTAATTTAMTIVPLTGASSTAQAFSASNVGAGSTVGVFQVAAGGQGITIDLTGIVLQGNASTENVTLRPANETSTLKVLLWFNEQR